MQAHSHKGRREFYLVTREVLILKALMIWHHLVLWTKNQVWSFCRLSHVLKHNNYSFKLAVKSHSIDKKVLFKRKRGLESQDIKLLLVKHTISFKLDSMTGFETSQDWAILSLLIHFDYFLQLSGWDKNKTIQLVQRAWFFSFSSSLLTKTLSN